MIDLVPLFEHRLSKIEDTSIEKRNQESPKRKVRNISLPNLKKKPSNLRDHRLRLKKRKPTVNPKEKMSKEKKESCWDDVFFHYFE